MAQVRTAGLPISRVNILLEFPRSGAVSSQIALSPGFALKEGQVKGVWTELTRQEGADGTIPVTLCSGLALYQLS